MALEYLRSATTDRFEHPILGAVFITAGIFAVTGFMTETLAETLVNSGVWPLGMEGTLMTAMFLGAYAVLTAALASIGYGILFLAKYASVIRDRASPT